MSTALFCRVDPSREQDRHNLRGDHLAYIAEHRAQIIAGGPTLGPRGTPEMMILLLDLDPAQAAAFITNEPYTANGVFAEVEIKPWAQVLPERTEGALFLTLAAELAARRS